MNKTKQKSLRVHFKYKLFTSMKDLFKKIILEKKLESEQSTITHNKKTYSINKIIKSVEKNEITEISISQLEWIIKSQKIEDFKTGKELKRIIYADKNEPIIIIKEKNKWIVLDGLHRLIKSMILGEKKLKVKKISSEELKNCLV